MLGVVLMVALTVILAAVIGSFVLGLGTSVQPTAPNANVQLDVIDGRNATATHTGGDSIPSDQVTVTEGSENASFPGDTVTAGTTSGNVTYTGADTVRVIWTSDNGDSSQTLAEESTP